MGLVGKKVIYRGVFLSYQVLYSLCLIFVVSYIFYPINYCHILMSVLFLAMERKPLEKENFLGRGPPRQGLLSFLPQPHSSTSLRKILIRFAFIFTRQGETRPRRTPALSGDHSLLRRRLRHGRQRGDLHYVSRVSPGRKSSGLDPQQRRRVAGIRRLTIHQNDREGSLSHL